MEIGKAPSVGWGIAKPDQHITEETLALVEKLKNLSAGQRDALLTRAVPRYLAVELELSGTEPDRSDMVTCSSALSNFWYDILGAP